MVIGSPCAGSPLRRRRSRIDVRFASSRRLRHCFRLDVATLDCVAGIMVSCTRRHVASPASFTLRTLDGYLLWTLAFLIQRSLVGPPYSRHSILPLCPLCGCGIDDEGHRVCWCPVVQAACQVATGQPWSFNALGHIPTSQFADFLSAVHSWAPGLRLPDADSPHQPAWCLARVRSLLSHRWMRQPLPSRTEGARTRLRQLGVRLTPSMGHLPELEFILAPSAVHVDWLEFTACQLRAVSRDDRFRLIASLMRTALCPTGSAICRSCRAAASVRKLIRRALAGAHLLRAAPRLDTGSYRRVSVGALGAGQCLAQWVSTGMGEALFCGGSSPPLLRQVAIGLDYNVVSHESGGCGATRYSIHAVRPVRPGEELISSITPPGISSSGSLLLTTDGGGNKGAVGCAVVGFV